MTRARYARTLDDGRVQCLLCPRECRMRESQRGFCYVRANVGGQLDLTTYGRSSGFAVDPVEKKPLNHFLPGCRVLSFGTAGCNLACKFCQNWHISKSRSDDSLARQASPEQIAAAALHRDTACVAYTYNDPVIFAEYAIDTAWACRERGIRNIAVTAGYISKMARADFFAPMDAANVDLKAFSDEFYRKITGGRLDIVLDNISWLVNETETWVELTTLLIPGYNDSDKELRELTRWVAQELGVDVPLHFSAFHPSYRMSDVAPTPPETLYRARQIGLDAGLRYVYTGNLHDPSGQSTFCPECGAMVIRRDWYSTKITGLANGHCVACGTAIAGVWR